MKRCREKRPVSEASVELTSMIDVVFLLLIFFLVTSQTPEVIGTHGADASRGVKSRETASLAIDVDSNGYRFQGRPANDAQLLRDLQRVFPNWDPSGMDRRVPQLRADEREVRF